MHITAADTGQKGNKICVGVSAIGSDAVAGLQAQAGKPGGNPIRRLVKRSERPIRVAEHQRRPVAKYACGPVQGITRGVAANEVHAQATASASISTTKRGSARPA